MGLFHAGVPPWLITWVVDCTPIRQTIETGTFQGDSAVLLADRIGRCISIEIDPALALRAQQRFADRADIEVVQGDSRRALPEAHATITGPVFYWLDGHWSGAETGGEDDPCPVMSEIDAIQARQNGAGSVIAIDDARMFGMSHSTDGSLSNWPHLSAVLRALERDGSQTFLADDVIVALPPDLVPSFLATHSSPDLRQRTILNPIWAEIQIADARRHQ